MTGEDTYKTVDFSSQYYLLRKKEGRVYSDREVAHLPHIDKLHQHYREWKTRMNSCNRLVSYLKKKNKPLRIAEVGCGNGWLSAKLSGIPLSQVAGIDINPEELRQASRVFNKIENLSFFECSLQDETIKHLQFDIIVFAASIQYFRDLNGILKIALNLLRPGGEIHIIDSHFYKKDEIEGARQRTEAYYRTIGFPELTGHYFHHSIGDILQFKYSVLFNPNSILNKLRKDRDPFYWICIPANA